MLSCLTQIFWRCKRLLILIKAYGENSLLFERSFSKSSSRAARPGVTRPSGHVFIRSPTPWITPRFCVFFFRYQLRLQCRWNEQHGQGRALFSRPRLFARPAKKKKSNRPLLRPTLPPPPRVEQRGKYNNNNNGNHKTIANTVTAKLIIYWCTNANGNRSNNKNIRKNNDILVYSTGTSTTMTILVTVRILAKVVLYFVQLYTGSY